MGPKKRTKSKAPPAKKQKTAAAATPAPAATPAAAPAVFPAKPAATPAATSSTKSAGQDKNTLSSSASNTLSELAAQANRGEKLVPSDFSSFNVKKLKLALKHNDRSSTGKRAGLVRQVILYMTSGCPPRCPDCGGGRLRFGKPRQKLSRDTSCVWCPGYMEDDEFINCGFTAESGDIDYIKWADPQ